MLTSVSAGPGGHGGGQVLRMGLLFLRLPLFWMLQGSALARGPVPVL